MEECYHGCAPVAGTVPCSSIRAALMRVDPSSRPTCAPPEAIRSAGAVGPAAEDGAEGPGLTASCDMGPANQARPGNGNVHMSVTRGGGQRARAEDGAEGPGLTASCDMGPANQARLGNVNVHMSVT